MKISNSFIPNFSYILSVHISIIFPLILEILFLGSMKAQDKSTYCIGGITIDRREIFDKNDLRENHSVGKFINGIHLLTRERVIRNELLIQQGDQYDDTRIQETERNLRSLGFIGDVTIHKDTIGSLINIKIETHDKWTMGFNTSYKQEGGIKNFNASLSENNFLGNGQKIHIGYNYLSDRNDPYGSEIILSENRLFSSRWAIALQYKNYEELNIKTFHIYHPFFSDTTKWAVGIYGDYGRIRLRRYEKGELEKENYLKQENQNIWSALSFGKLIMLRTGIAYVRVRTQTDKIELRTFDNLDLMNLSLCLMQREYYQGRFLNNFGRVEDVPIGFLINVLWGKNFRFSYKNLSNYFLLLNFRHALCYDERYYLNYNLSYSCYFLNTGFSDATLTASTIQHLRISPRHTLVYRLIMTYGSNWSTNNQITLGSPNGLRGYNAYQFSGQRQIICNIEDRIYPDLNFWIFRLGGVLFFDSGTVWSEKDQLSKQKLHSSIGIGLRIENTKQQGSGIIRIDIPFNLDEKRFSEIIISSNQLFSAFADIGYILPNMILSFL